LRKWFRHEGIALGPQLSEDGGYEWHCNGLSVINTVRELVADIGRLHQNLYEVTLWEDLVTVQGSEVFYCSLVDNQAIVVPETIDAIRALTELERDPRVSIERTNVSLGISNCPLKQAAWSRQDMKRRNWVENGENDGRTKRRGRVEGFAYRRVRNHEAWEWSLRRPILVQDPI
jgi:hypothetical protein